MADNIIQGLLPSGKAAPVLEGQIQQMIAEGSVTEARAVEIARANGLPPNALPIFATREHALAYEMATPGAKALYFDASGVGALPSNPSSPATPVATVTDYAYQWLGSDFTATGWKDTKQGVVLTPSDSSVAAPTKSGSTAVFSTKAGMRAPGALALGSGAKTMTVVAKLSTVTSSLWGVAGNPSAPTLALPGGGGAKAGWYPGGAITATNISGSADTGMHVMTVRVDGDSSTLTHDRVTVAARSVENTQFSVFQIGGQHYGGIFQGAVAEVRIYNRRLTDDELTALHDSLGGKYGVAF